MRRSEDLVAAGADYLMRLAWVPWVRRWKVVAGKLGGGGGAIGSGPGEFWSPGGIVVDGNGTVWVADSGNNRIQRSAWDGERE